MTDIKIHSTPTASWQALIHEAQDCACVHLGEELESYLVFLLMRYIEKTHFANAPLAEDLLEAMQKNTGLKRELLQDVGDRCLLISGLFPERTQRKRVNKSYYMDLGQSAFWTLTETKSSAFAALYCDVCENFREMSTVLCASRQLDSAMDLEKFIHVWEAPHRLN